MRINHNEIRKDFQRFGITFFILGPIVFVLIGFSSLAESIQNILSQNPYIYISHFISTTIGVMFLKYDLRQATEQTYRRLQKLATIGTVSTIITYLSIVVLMKTP